MDFTKILGQTHLKNHLMKSADNGRVSHAQLFVGKEGCGTLPMAIAYAQYLLCSNSKNKNACELTCEKLAHPDLYFAFPTVTNDKVKKDPTSNLFLEDWRKFIAEKPYGSLFDWHQYIGAGNKQGQIRIEDAKEIVKFMSLKSFEGGYKVMIIWMAEKMNREASNKLLKFIEEPPKNTIFLLVTEREDQILTTIKSRCQALYFPLLPEADIVKGLLQAGIDDKTAKNIAHQADGNFNKALALAHEGADDIQFEKWLVMWLRAAFKARGNANVIRTLIEVSEVIAKTGRETQKKYLTYCLQFFRQALLLNYNVKELVYLQPKTEGFKMENFAPFVHSKNILSMTKEFNDAIYHIERNGNSKIILLDLSIKLTRLLHTKE